LGTIENISMNLQKSSNCEDGTFLKHNGFDCHAKAYKSNERERRIKGGNYIPTNGQVYFFARP
jgi:hypothetical protein